MREGTVPAEALPHSEAEYGGRAIVPEAEYGGRAIVPEAEHGARPALPLRITAEQVETLSVDDLADLLVRIEVEVSRLEQNRLVVLAEFDEREGHRVFGHPSATAFLKQVCRMSGGRARRLVNSAGAAAKHHDTMAAWRFGHLSIDQAQQLFDVSREILDKYAAAEQVLLDIAGEHPDETRKTLNYWKNTADPAGTDLDMEAQLQRRSLDFTTRANGTVVGRFSMTGLAGEAFKTAIDVLMPPPGPADERTASQRRHDALEDLARDHLERTNTTENGGEKPHISLHCDLDALKAEPGGLHETTDGTVLSVSVIRQLACDASVTRIVFDSESEILDVGRKTRTISPAQRRALVARDRHCQWPGCKRSARWCDAHHRVHWADGGETALSNLVLLCRFHHTLTHRHDIDIRLGITKGEVPAIAGSARPQG